MADQQAFRHLLDAVKLASRRLGGTAVSEVRVTLGVAERPAIKLRCPPGADIYFTVMDGFPEVPPVFTVCWGDGSDGAYARIEWNPVDIVGSVESALSNVISGAAPFQVLYGETPAKPLTGDRDIALRMGWRRVLTGHQLQRSLKSALSERVDPATIEALSGSSVVIFGLGSVGSFLAEQLARAGVGRIVGIDPDIVEPGNLSRTVYTDQDVGLSKAFALERRLREIDPGLDVAMLQAAHDQIGSENLRAMFKDATLVIAATDDPRAQTLINRCAVAADTAALFIGLYRGAKGGEVVFSIPQATGCFTCATGGVRNVGGDADVLREVDYGTRRLSGEIALGSDIHHVTTAAVKIAVGLIALINGRRDSHAAQFILSAVLQEKSAVLFSMSPDFWSFPYWMANASGQYAFQSVWVSVPRNPDCDHCGDAAQADDPFRYAAPTPSRDMLRGHE